MSSPDDGRYINKEQAKGLMAKGLKFNVRYDQLRKVTPVSG